MNIPGIYIDEATELLREMVSIPSYSYHEDKVAVHIAGYLKNRGVNVERIGDNIISYHSGFDPSLPSLLLNSHLDTVTESKNYTFDPFNPPHNDKTVFGLGSNDAGGSVVSMIQTFLYFRDIALQFNVVLILSAQEECSGKNGMDSLSSYINRDIVKNMSSAEQVLASIRYGIVGEPTGMRAAIGERGLLVIDAVAHGKSGHAARDEGINSIYIALRDIETIRNFHLPEISPSMGEVKFTVTQIEAGSHHNVVPESCRFVIDIRSTEQYSNEDILNILQQNLESKLTARNLRNRSSVTPIDTSLYRAIEKSSIEKFTSPTTSDWMRLDIPAFKMGPGDSARSHKADEYIHISEIADGIKGYIRYIENLKEIL